MNLSQIREKMQAIVKTEGSKGCWCAVPGDVENLIVSVYLDGYKKGFEDGVTESENQGKKA